METSALTPALTDQLAASGFAVLPNLYAPAEIAALLLHASNRSTGTRPRRVIHLEFVAAELPAGLAWRERRAVPAAN